MRAVLRAAREDASVQDQIDCADLLLAGGHAALAAPIYVLAGLELGFGADGLHLLTAVNAEAGFWDQLPNPASSARGGFAIDIAIEDIARLMALEPVLPPLPDDISSVVPARSQSGASCDGDLLALAERVTTQVRDLPRTATEGKLTDALTVIADMLAGQPLIAIDAYANAGLATLTRLFVLARIRDFLAVNLDLLQVSPKRLFEEAAKLRSDALGPFFSNLWRLMRDTRDVFFLIDAALQGRSNHRRTELWSILLASHLPHANLASLTAELGDRGMADALNHILFGLARRSPRPSFYGVAASIRDASLDIDAFTVAEKAQHLLVLWHPTNASEWRRLGEIRALCERTEAAQEALEEGLRLDPYDSWLLRARANLAAGRAIPVENMVPERRYARRMRLDAFRRAEREAE